MLLAGVRPGGAADLAGCKRGDLLVRVGKHRIDSVADLMFVLGELKPRTKTKLGVVRDGKDIELEAEVQASNAPAR